MDRAGADASRLLWRKVSEPSIIRGIPADASGAAWPCPQTNDRIFSEKAAYGHPSLNGYHDYAYGKHNRDMNLLETRGPPIRR